MSRLAACRSCGGADLRAVLSLGRTPLANSLLTSADLASPEPRFPLDLHFCEGCSLLQISETVPPDALFREYLYFSSYSDTVLENARRLAGRLIRERALGPDSLVVEIASNDGYLLRNFVAAGVPVLGVEPARNIARVAEERGVRTVAEFFGADLAAGLVADGFRADLILANNVMAHVPDINGVVAGIRSLLRPDGAFVMETPYVRDMVERLEFDTIYHEHLFYYSLTALEALFRRHGLAAAAVERIPIHGGSLRVTAVPAERAGACPDVLDLLREEEAAGLTGWEYYRGFSGRVTELGARLKSLLGQLKAEGKRVAAYGAAAKGTTLLNTFEIGRETLEFVVDRSPAKQGRFTPGTHIPVHAPDMLLRELPEYVLLLAWNFAEEIMEQQAEYRARGGRFILPVPDVRVV